MALRGAKASRGDFQHGTNFDCKAPVYAEGRGAMSEQRRDAALVERAMGLQGHTFEETRFSFPIGADYARHRARELSRDFAFVCRVNGRAWLVSARL